jgi:flagellar biosynthetic protein FlhB
MALQLVGEDSAIAMSILILLGITLLVIVVPFEILQLRGLVFSSQPLKPDFSRLNPAKGFKRLFSVRMLKEALKNIIKFAIYGALAVFAIRHTIGQVGFEATTASQLASVLWTSSVRLIGLFAPAALALAALDQIIARREFAKQMRMSRSELTREYKEREGEPRIKAKRKQLHAEFIKQTEGIGKLGGSDLVIVNPEHFAVALAYDSSTMSAPTVRAKARNQLALAMRREAARLNIPIVADPPLARELYKSGAAGREIGADHYRAVAGHYSHLRANQEI